MMACDYISSLALIDKSKISTVTSSSKLRTSLYTDTNNYREKNSIANDLPVCHRHRPRRPRIHSNKDMCLHHLNVYHHHDHDRSQP